MKLRNEEKRNKPSKERRNVTQNYRWSIKTLPKRTLIVLVFIFFLIFKIYDLWMRFITIIKKIKYWSKFSNKRYYRIEQLWYNIYRHS